MSMTLVVAVMVVVIVVLGLVLVHEPVLVAFRHGRGLEVKGQVAHSEAFGQQMLDAMLVGLRFFQPLGIHDDVGGADRQVAADAPGAQILDAADSR